MSVKKKDALSLIPSWCYPLCCFCSIDC